MASPIASFEQRDPCLGDLQLLLDGICIVLARMCSQFRQASDVVLHLLQMVFERVNPGIDLLGLVIEGRRMLLRLLKSHGKCHINFVVGNANGLHGQLMFFRGTCRISETECCLQRGFDSPA